MYHIDRMMVQLKRGGKLNKLAGLIVGHMSDMKDNAVPFGSSAYEIIASHVNMFEYPVCFGFPVGHDFDNLTLISGGTYEFEVNNDAVKLKYIS